MSIKTTTLDQRLYAWLLEADDHRFERAFSAYYSVAFPALIRRLARVSGWQDVQLEELAQDALLRFFDKAGRARREASEAVGESLAQIRPLGFGAFHERQVRGWTKDVASFRDATMGFEPPSVDDAENVSWKVAISNLADQIPPLQMQGSRLLHSVRVELNWRFDDEAFTGSISETPEIYHPTNDLDDPSLLAGNIDSAIPQSLGSRMVDEITLKSPRAQAAERDHPGTLSFVQSTWVVILNIPRLRVPTNGYLFEIATTIYLDECKKRGRKKRGGSGLLIDQTDAAPAGHPLEAMVMDVENADEQFPDTPLMPVHAPAGFIRPAIDPTSQYERDDLFQKFYDYLRRPVDDALEALEQAQTRGRAVAQRRKLESMTQKFERTMSVLTVIGEGYTQEQAAERLGLTRNQVKYIIELVQEAYTRFAGNPAGSGRRSTDVGGSSHAL